MDTASQAALDLCWAINSPSLIEGSNVAPTPRLDINSIDQDHLEAFLASEAAERGPVHRVGRYFEQLINYWLRHVREVEVVANGLQLKDDKITVGEIDFLHRDESGALVHCEATIKYFLCAPGAEPSEFPGPNARDNYEAKITKLFNQQLPASIGRVPDIDERLALVKGMIFYHPSESEAAVPDRLPVDHQRGGWFRYGESPVEVDGVESTDVFTIVAKPHWLAPGVGATHEPMSLAALEGHLATHFADATHPLMISVRRSSDVAAETKRLFVVSEAWPKN